MPAQSKAQQKFMGMVHALKKGDIKPSDVSKDVKDAAKSMSKKDAKDFASTKHKGLPKRIKQEIARRLRDEGKLAGPMAGSYAIPSQHKQRKHKDTDNLGKRDRDNISGQPDLEEGGSFQRGSHRKPPAPYGGLNHHILNKSSVRKHDDDANFPKKDSGQEDMEENKFAKKPEVNPKQLLKIQSDVRKINRKIKVYISKHPVSKGRLEIELGAGHDNDAEIDKIYKVLKKHTGNWRTGTMFNEEKITEVGVFPVTNYISGIIPKGRLDTNTPEAKKKSEKLVKDLRKTLNTFWKQHDIPFKIK